MRFSFTDPLITILIFYQNQQMMNTQVLRSILEEGLIGKIRIFDQTSGIIRKIDKIWTRGSLFH